MLKPKINLVNNKNNYNNLLDIVINSRKPIIVAHRGASNIAPENSIPAIDEAAKMGYWGVELDVCSSSDGVLYLLHDGTLDRTTNGHGLITRKSSHIIDRLIINNGPNISSYPNLRLPRLENALIECKKDKLTPIFDIKFLSNRDRDLNTFLRIVRKHGYERKLLVHSFNYKDLEYLRSKDKTIILMPMVNPNRIIYGYRYIKSFGATEVDCNINYLNKRLVQQAHKDGLKVFCWTIDTPMDLNKALHLGVDFIYSDTFYPVIYTKKDTQVEHMGLNTSGFSGKNLSYIFVDGILNTKQQLSNSKSNMDLKGNDLKIGKHKVDIIQFNNNKTNDKVITHKTAYYEVKSK